MDLATTLSAAQIVQSTSFDQAFLTIESACISQFWLPQEVQADYAFSGAGFEKYLVRHDVNFRHVPPQQHSLNPLESKHGTIRSIFLKLHAGEPDVDVELYAFRSLSMFPYLTICMAMM